MSDAARKNLGKLLGFIPQRAYRSFTRRSYFGFFYHIVSDYPRPHISHLYPHRPVQFFERDLAYILKNYSLLSYQDLEQGDYLQGQKPGAYLSFDDGFSECYAVVRPILLRFGIPCTFFLATDFIDNRQMYYRNKVSLVIDRIQTIRPSEAEEIMQSVRQMLKIELKDGAGFIRWLKSLSDDDLIDRICEMAGVDVQDYLKAKTPYLTSDQVRALFQDGFTIGAHSKSHHKLGGLTTAQIETEIVESCHVIREITGQIKVPFSFPNSGDGLRRDFLGTLREANPDLGLYFDTKGIRKDQDFVLNRIWVEAPKFNKNGPSPLPVVLHLAYQENALHSFLDKRTDRLKTEPNVSTGNQDPIEVLTPSD